MACPNYGVINEELTFTVRSYTNDGSPVDTDSLPKYKIYEDGTNSYILKGTMKKFDDDNTTGFYKKTITITENKFTPSNTYIIDIKTKVGGIPVAISYSFICTWNSTE